MAELPWGGSEELWSAIAIEGLKRNYEIRALLPAFAVTHPKRQALIDRGMNVDTWDKQEMAALQQAILTNQRTHELGASPYKQVFQTQFDLLIVSHGGLMDMVNGHITLPNHLWKCGRPYAIIIQANTDQYWPDKDQAAFMRLYFNEAISVVFVSRQNLELARRQVESDIPNAVVWNQPLNLPERPLLEWPKGGRLRMASVARLHIASKGQDLLIQALSLRQWKDRDWQLDIFGEGPNRQALENLVKKWGLDDKIHFLGHTSEVIQIWKDHHLLVMPSRLEGTPLALLECLSCGRPALTTDTGGSCDWIIDNCTGFAAGEANLENVANSLNRMWEKKSELADMGRSAWNFMRMSLDQTPGESLLNFLTCQLSSPPAYIRSATSRTKIVLTKTENSNPVAIINRTLRSHTSAWTAFHNQYQPENEAIEAYINQHISCLSEDRPHTLQLPAVGQPLAHAVLIPPAIANSIGFIPPQVEGRFEEWISHWSRQNLAIVSSRVERSLRAKSTRISVVVPFQDDQETMDDCIHSILSSAEGNIEIVLVDYGSNDITPILAERLLRKYPLIISYPPYIARSRSDAINVGASQSRGDWLVIIDACDRVTKDGILQLASMKKDSLDLICIHTIPVSHPIPAVQPNLPQRDFADSQILPDKRIPMMVRRNFWTSTRGFNRSLHELADFDYFVRSCLAGGHIRMLAESEPSILATRPNKSTCRLSNIQWYKSSLSVRNRESCQWPIMSLRQARANAYIIGKYQREKSTHTTCCWPLYRLAFIFLVAIRSGEVVLAKRVIIDLSRRLAYGKHERFVQHVWIRSRAPAPLLKFAFPEILCWRLRRIGTLITRATIWPRKTRHRVSIM